MKPPSRRYRWLALAGIVVVATSSPARGQDPSSSRERPAQNAPANAATAETPPFWLAGVVITPAQRSAVLAVLDDARREVGFTTLREGESFGGYRLVAVEPGRVLLERGDARFAVPVGRPKGAADTSARGGAGPAFIPGPQRPTPDVPYAGPQVIRGAGPITSDGSGGAGLEPPAQNILQRLLESPQFQQRIEEMRQRRSDRARQDNQALPEPPAEAATAKPPQRTPQ